MTILVLGFLTVFVPVTLVLWFALSSNRDRFEWVVKFLLVGNVTFIFFQIGPWAITSYYLRYVVIAFFLLGAIYSYLLKNWSGLSTRKGSVRGLLGKAALAMVFIWLNTVSVIGQLPPETSVSLRFPLKNGSYYLLQGGTTWTTNLFHSLIPTGKYAVDIVQLDDFGNRAKTFLPHQLTEYHIYGSGLYSPCTGTVKQAVGSLTDNIPPAVDWEHREGNHVAISCNGVEVTLLHMKAGSLKVSNGDTVTAGQPIGMVGNSGYSDEPHLHIQVNTEDGHPMPIEFNGRFLSTNDVYNN